MRPISEEKFVTGYFQNNHPAFLLIPFRRDDIFLNRTIAKKTSIKLKNLLEERFPNKYIAITSNGREALELALDALTKKFHKYHKVRIQTTSDNFYISGCVTTIIQKNHNWHRNLNETEDILLVNHEFGYVDNRVDGLADNNSNLIEDCAFSFNSKYTDGKRCGSIAPYSVFSFSKFFPIQVGGCLVSDYPIEEKGDRDLLNYVKNVVGYYFNEIEEWSEVRLNIYDYYTKVFRQLGCTPVFKRSSNDIPGVFLFDLPTNINAQKLKEYYWERGVQCSAFYGRQAFYLPLNQYTTSLHVDFFADIFNSFELDKNE